MKKCILSVPYFKQDREYSCGPACLQMVFSYYHKRMSEEDLMRELRTNEAIGTRPSWMIRVARRHGFFCYVNNDSSLDEVRYFLRLKKPLIVYFVEPFTGDDHFTVIVGFDKEKIIMNDSLMGEGYEFFLDAFDKRWHGEKKYQKTLRRWMLVISPEEIPMGRQYKPTSKIFKKFLS